MNTLNIALCAGRHEIPQATDGAIYPQTIADPTDLTGLERTAAAALSGYARGWGMVNLYVTGMTAALCAVINVACSAGVRLTLWHYNSQTGGYYPQEINTRVDADICEETYGGYARR